MINLDVIEEGNKNYEEFKKIYNSTGTMMAKSEDPKQFLYSYSFAELLDRASIVLMKIANSKDPSAFEKELQEILHDIQLHLNQTPMNAEMVKGLIVLTQVNTFIWNNESEIRDADDNNNIEDSALLAKLKETHRANSLRGSAKKHIQIQRNSRTDEKLNYGKDAGMWNIKW